MNGHGRPRVGHETISVLGNLETSLLKRWRSVLHKIDDKDDEQTTEDRRLTAALGMAIGHTRRLCARFPNEATSAYFQEHKPSHATRLELANIEAWLHEEGSRTPVDLHLHDATMKVRVVKHSGDEIDPEKTSIPQEPSGGSADQSHEDDVSSDETQTEELKLSKIRFGDDPRGGRQKSQQKDQYRSHPQDHKKTTGNEVSTKLEPVHTHNLTKSYSHTRRHP